MYYTPCAALLVFIRIGAMRTYGLYVLLGTFVACLPLHIKHSVVTQCNVVKRNLKETSVDSSQCCSFSNLRR